MNLRALLIVAAVAVAAWLPAASQDHNSSSWHPDILGQGYEARTVSLAPDSEGDAVATIVRKLTTSRSSTRRGVLYIHGFNDYFFQSQMGDSFAAHGYDFYAVDLRRYGRSIRPGQKPFAIRSLDHYFPEIDSALTAMRSAELDTIVLMGHSTGGLIAAYFESRRRPADIRALILNSPFLDWNLGSTERFIPIVSWVGSWWPSMKINQGLSTAYAQSLQRSDHGEWDYRTDWKFAQSPPVTAGWVRAIDKAQKALRGGKADIRVPILLLYSSQSIDGDTWTPSHQRGDAVLSVSDIKHYGLRLGPRITPVRVQEGLHDLVLSRPGVREPLYAYIFSWLARTLP